MRAKCRRLEESLRRDSLRKHIANVWYKMPSIIWFYCSNNERARTKAISFIVAYVEMSPVSNEPLDSYALISSKYITQNRHYHSLRCTQHGSSSSHRISLCVTCKSIFTYTFMDCCNRHCCHEWFHFSSDRYIFFSLVRMRCNQARKPPATHVIVFILYKITQMIVSMDCDLKVTEDQFCLNSQNGFGCEKPIKCCWFRKISNKILRSIKWSVSFVMIAYIRSK